MSIFSEEAKQQVLDALFDLATNGKNVPAIKLYLDLAQEKSPADSFTLEMALEILRRHENVKSDVIP